jgi:hypothetical protein
LREEQDAAYRAALEADQVCLCFFFLFLLEHLVYIMLVLLVRCDGPFLFAWW